MIPGIRYVDKTMADGTVRRYVYDKRTRRRIMGEIGSEEFMRNLEIARSLPPIQTKIMPMVGEYELPRLRRHKRLSFIYFIQGRSR
jgi:hypothetical protein